MVRRAFLLLVVAPIAVGFFLYTRAGNSDQIKREALGIADNLPLSGDERAHVRGWIDAAHADAFDRALSSANTVGIKFDTEVYIDELWRRMIDAARDEGMDDLADKLDREKGRISFEVAER